MLEKKKNTEEVKPEAAAQTDEKELSLDECAQVTGGSIHHVHYTKTHDIDKDIRDRI